MGKARKRYTYLYPRPAVTVDLVIISEEEESRVLLIRRKNDPFAGMWALPGGFIEINESLEAAARRELYEETGVEVEHLEQLHTFGAPGRDPRGRTITVAYLAVVAAANLHPRAADDAALAGWHPLQRLPALAFDHADILAYALRWLEKQPRKPR